MEKNIQIDVKMPKKVFKDLVKKYMMTENDIVFTINNNNFHSVIFEMEKDKNSIISIKIKLNYYFEDYDDEEEMSYSEMIILTDHRSHESELDDKTLDHLISVFLKTGEVINLLGDEE